MCWCKRRPSGRGPYHPGRNRGALVRIVTGGTPSAYRAARGRGLQDLRVGAEDRLPDRPRTGPGGFTGPPAYRPRCGLRDLPPAGLGVDYGTARLRDSAWITGPPAYGRAWITGPPPTSRGVDFRAAAYRSGERAPKRAGRNERGKWRREPLGGGGAPERLHVKQSAATHRENAGVGTLSRRISAPNRITARAITRSPRRSDLPV
jgi:hypothetical protein